jgi:hypothetical protein
MKFICSTVIDLPINRTIELYQLQEDFNQWHLGFVSKELISGLSNQINTKSKLVYHNNNNVIELVETILPPKSENQFISLYEHKHMINIMTSTFSTITKNQTRLDVEIHYTKFIGFMPKLMAILMPGVFKKQTQKMVDNFKNYAGQKK